MQTAGNGDVYKKKWEVGKKLPDGKFQKETHKSLEQH